MPTWQDARDKLRRDLWRPGVNGLPDATADENIHAACLELEGERRWLWAEVVRSSDVVTGNQVALPPDCGAISSLAIVWPDGRRDLLAVEQLDRVRRSAALSTGDGFPSTYARTGSDAFFDDGAPTAATLELIYSAATPEDIPIAVTAGLVPNGNVTLAKQFGAVCALAASYVAATYLKDDEEARRQSAVYERFLDRMIETDDLRRSDDQGEQVRADWFYQAAAFGMAACP